MALDFTRGEAKQWALESIKGFYMCPISPVNDQFEIDEPALRQNIEAFIEMGVNGLVVGGFISEGWNLTPSKWLRYHQVVADVAKGRIPLWTIILDPCVHTALEKLDAVEKMGFEGAEVINPVVQLRTDDEIFDWFKYLTDRTDLAICLYRTPVSGKVMGFDLMKRLSDLETCIAVKQGSLVRAETLKLRRLIRDDFIVSDPSEAVFLEELRIGGQVVWGELSYILYGKKRHIVDEYRALAAKGEWEQARVVSDQLNPIRLMLEDLMLWKIAETATYAGTIAGVKGWFEAIGLNGGNIIPPLKTVSQAEKDALKGTLQDLGVC
ncbi:MAG: dihydrodipicolinate synthase family protein [Immundisolibacteraceae bacterium]|nr:dihydrodipicolinate synthase family protein [Immundisolibacteraceae bacterium]